MPRSKRVAGYPSQFITLVDLFDQTTDPIELPFPTHRMTRSFKSKWYQFIGALENESQLAYKRKDYEEAGRYRSLAAKARSRELCLEHSKIVFTLRDVSYDASVVEGAIDRIIQGSAASNPPRQESRPPPDFESIIGGLNNDPPVEGFKKPSPSRATAPVGPIDPSSIGDKDGNG